MKKPEIASLYNLVAEAYGSVGPPFLQLAGERLVQAAAISPGEHVLDVATGRGAALFPAARAVGPTGSVVGIDLADNMIAALAADIRCRGVTNASVRVMDAESLELPDERFDVVLCSFALFLFDPLDAALREFRRVPVPVPGGRVAVAMAGKGDERWAWYDKLLASLTSHLSPSDPTVDLRDVDELRGAFERAGFVDVAPTHEELDLKFASQDEWWRAQWTHGARYPLDHLDRGQIAQLLEAARIELARLQGPDGTLPWLLRLLVVTARKPTRQWRP